MRLICHRRSRFVKINRMEKGQKRESVSGGSSCSDSDTSKTSDETSSHRSTAAVAAKHSPRPVLRNQEGVEWQQSLQDAWRKSLGDFDSDVFQGNTRSDAQNSTGNVLDTNTGNVVQSKTENDTQNNTGNVTNTDTDNIVVVEEKQTFQLLTTLEPHTAQVKTDDTDCKPQEVSSSQTAAEITCTPQSSVAKTDNVDGQQEQEQPTSVQAEAATVFKRTVSPQEQVRHETARIFTQRTYNEAQERRKVIRIARSTSIEAHCLSEGDSASEYSGLCSEEESGGGGGGGFRGITRSVSSDVESTNAETTLRKGSASSSRSSNLDQTGVVVLGGSEETTSKGIKFAMSDWKSSRQSSVQQITVKAKTVSRTMSVDNTLERRYAATMERHIKELKSK